MSPVFQGWTLWKMLASSRKGGGGDSSQSGPKHACQPRFLSPSLLPLLQQNWVNAVPHIPRTLSLLHGFALCLNVIFPCPLPSEVKCVLQMSVLLWNPPWFPHNRLSSFVFYVSLLFCTHISAIIFYCNGSVSPIDDQNLSHWLSIYYVPDAP